MSKISVSPIRRRVPVAYPDDVDMHQIDFPAEVVWRDASAPFPAGGRLNGDNQGFADSHEDPLQPLTDFLGTSLTTGSAVWSQDSVDRMRFLQKRLIEHSLTLASSERTGCLGAISVVENAIQLRLRLEQMRKSELEYSETNPTIEQP